MPPKLKLWLATLPRRIDLPSKIVYLRQHVTRAKLESLLKELRQNFRKIDWKNLPQQIKAKAETIDWQELSERLDPERITSDARFQKFMERLRLPDYVLGPTDETEFLPAALEIVETPPAPAARIIGRVIIALIAVALLWSILGSVDIIATAQGKIVPTGRTKIIQPFETGVVHSIHVQDGQIVKAGDVLVEIDSTINESERDRLQKEYIEAELNVARLKAAIGYLDNPSDNVEADFIAPEGASDAQIATEKNFLTNQLQEIRAKLDGLDQQIAKEQGNLDSVQSTITKLTDSIPFLQKRAEAKDYLAKRGYGSKLEYLTTQQDLVEHQQELEVQKGKLAEATASVASLQQQRKQAEAEWRRTNLDQLTQDQEKASSLQEQLAGAAEKTRLQTLTSPVDGTVQQLEIHTEGGVVTPAEALMAIVPADSHLEIEAMVSNKDIGFIHAGQSAAIKVDTFDYTKYGLLHGKVLSVSQDAILRDNPTDKSSGKSLSGDQRDSSEPKGQELNYAARVLLDQTQMQVDDRLVGLAPGMAVTVEIKTGSRRIISYLLSPIQKHLHQAMRER
jgi:hemolysin D